MTTGNGNGSGAAGFFNAFANAMLERTLPQIRHWLESRLGATVGKLEVEGARIRITDARIPLGARIALHVDTATLMGNPEDLAAGRNPLSLERLNGNLRAKEGDEVVFDAPVVVTARPGTGRAWVNADIVVSDGHWRVRQGVGAAAPLDGTARIEVTTDGWKLEDANLTSGLSNIELSANGGMRDNAGLKRARLKAGTARVGHFVDAITAWMGSDAIAALPLPPDALLSGVISLEGQNLTADVKFSTDESELALILDSSVGPRSTIRTGSLYGELAWSDLPSSGFVDAAKSPKIKVGAQASGSLGAPLLTIDLDAADVHCPWLSAPSRWTLSLTRDAERWTAKTDLSDVFVASATLGRSGLSVEGSGEGELKLDRLELRGGRFDGPPVALELSASGPKAQPTYKLAAKSPTVSWRRGSWQDDEDSAVLALRRVGLELARTAESFSVRANARTQHGSISVRSKAGSFSLAAQRVDSESSVALGQLVLGGTFIGRAADDTRFSWPDDAELWADLAWADRVLDGKVHVETKRSRVSFEPVRFQSFGARMDGTTAHGTIAFADAITFGLFKGPVQPVADGRFGSTFDVRAEVSGGREGLALHAELSAQDSAWNTGLVPRPLPLRNARAKVAFRRDAITFDHVGAELFGGTISSGGSLTREGFRVDRLAINNVGDALFAWLGRPVTLGISIDAALRGTAGGLSGPIEAATPNSSVTLELELDNGSFDGTTIEGRIDSAELIDGPVGVDGIWRIEGQVHDRLESPSAELSVTSDEIAVTVAGQTHAVTGVKIALRLDPATVAWSSASANLLDGYVRSNGLIGFGEGFDGFAAKLEANVDLEAITSLEPWLAGRLESSLALWGPRWNPAASASIRVSEPRYSALNRLRETFSRYGLKALPIRGGEPLRADLAFSAGQLDLQDVGLAVKGARVTGSLSRDPDERWFGSMRLVLEQSWLETSHLLGPPARWFGDVVLPLRIGGTGVPRVRPDTLAALDEWIAKTRVARAVRAGLEHFAFGKKPAPEPRRIAAIHLVGKDELVDRAAAGGEDAWEAVGRLLAIGVKPGDIAAAIRARRRS